MILEVRAKPGARTTSFEVKDGIIHARIAAPPVDGEANEKLLRALAKQLGVARKAVSLRTGSTSRNKLIEIETEKTKEVILGKLVNTYK